MQRVLERIEQSREEENMRIEEMRKRKEEDQKRAASAASAASAATKPKTMSRPTRRGNWEDRIRNEIEDEVRKRVKDQMRMASDHMGSEIDRRVNDFLRNNWDGKC